MARGQLSLELFFSVLLFSLLFLWTMNYAGVFSQGLGEVGAGAQAKSLAASIAIVANGVCAHQASASFMLPCASSAGLPRALSLSQTNSTQITVFVPGEPTNATSSAACPVTASLSSLCKGGQGDWVCFKTLRGAVTVSKGRC